jgi:hypothetical protein
VGIITFTKPCLQWKERKAYREIHWSQIVFDCRILASHSCTTSFQVYHLQM